MDDRYTGRFDIPESTMYPLQPGMPAMYLNTVDDTVPSWSQPAPMERTDSGETCGTTDSGYESTYSAGNAGSSYIMADVGFYNNAYQYDNDAHSDAYHQYDFANTESQYPSHQEYAPYSQDPAAPETFDYTSGVDMNAQIAWAPPTEGDLAAAGVSYQPSQAQYEGPYAGYAGEDPVYPVPTGATGAAANQPGYDHASSSPALSASATATPQAGKFPCLWPECESTFSRTADLDRHQKKVHFRTDSAGDVLCDYPRCERHSRGFSRQDHCRDHYRTVHKEDVPRRGHAAEGPRWWAERSLRAVYEGWWRCNRCLARVVVGEDGYACPACGSRCETERQAVRNLPVACDHEGCRGAPPFYRHDWLRDHLARHHGEDLPRPAQMEQQGRGAKELDSHEWWRSRIFSRESWRCNRCLVKVDSRESGWQCPACWNPCEVQRVKVRGGVVD